MPKQYATLGSSTVIEYAMAPFEADVDCASITIAISADDELWPALAVLLCAALWIACSAAIAQANVQVAIWTEGDLPTVVI